MDAYRSDTERGAARMTVEEAARSLGIKEESVRKRVRRKKIRSEKDEDGRLYVYVDPTETIRGERVDLYGGQSTDEPGYGARELIGSKDETIRILQVQLQKEREARRLAHISIAQLTQANAALVQRITAQRVTELEASQTSEEATRGAAGGTTRVQQDATSEPHDSARPRDTAEFPVRGSLIHPWWRRVFGG